MATPAQPKRHHMFHAIKSNKCGKEKATTAQP